ncbi:MFS transporter [Paraburkholderia pallida]|uniref:MFS transporter n=1 Tax=Paraburkholderia pallida TaxID=2547399 RepID=A0A4P7DAH2_9BURK|nr:MFS transporter [Paraburkholderia pallida]QBR04135.1 MFS transporter [Paraburkholderia pallida]
MEKNDIRSLIDRQSRNPLRLSVATLCFLVLLLDGYELNLIGYVGPALLHQFSISKGAVGPVASAGLFGYMLGSVLLGNMGDRFGRKPMIVLGTLLFGTLTLAAVWSHSLNAFIAMRFLAGIGLGGAVPNAIALNTEFAPEHSRGWTIGLMFVGYSLGSAAPGWVAAAFLSHYGWRGVFYVGAFAPMLVAALMMALLPESLEYLYGKRNVQKLHALLKRMNIDLPMGMPEFGGTNMAAGGATPLQLFLNGHKGNTLLVWAAFVFCLMGNLFVMVWAPILFTGFGIEPGRAALIGAMWQTGGALGALAITRLLDRYGMPVVACAIFMAMPCVMLNGSAGAPESMLLVMSFVGGALGSGGQVGLNAIAGTIYPTNIRSTGVGWAFGVGRVGAILGPMLAGALLARNTNPRIVFIVMSFSFAVAALSVAMMHLRTTTRAKLTASRPVRTSGP